MVVVATTTGLALVSLIRKGRKMDATKDVKVKKVSGIKSKKAAWRRLDRIEDSTATLDVKDTLVNRFIRESKKVKQTNQLFSLDALGANAHLSQSTKKLITRRKQGVAELSRHHLRAIEKRQSTLGQREESLKEETKRRQEATEVFDLWGDNKDDDRNRVVGVVAGNRLPEIARAPAVKLPLSGQSVNPSPENFKVRACA